LNILFCLVVYHLDFTATDITTLQLMREENTYTCPTRYVKWNNVNRAIFPLVCVGFSQLRALLYSKYLLGHAYQRTACGKCVWPKS